MREIPSRGAGRIDAGLFVGVHSPGQCQLLGGQLLRSTTDPATSSSSCEAGIGSLLDHVMLKLDQGTKDVEDQLATSRGGVNRLAEGAKADAAGLELDDRRDQVLQRSTQTIMAPYNQGISWANVGDSLLPKSVMIRLTEWVKERRH